MVPSDCTAALESRFSILEAIAQRTARWDAKDVGAYAATFTEDAVWETPRACLVGRAAIAEQATDRLQGALKGIVPFHLNTDVVFTELGIDAAVTRHRELVYHRSAEAGPPHFASVGIVEIRWRRTGDGWKAAGGEFRTW